MARTTRATAMPSKRPRLNIRLDPETADRVARLLPVAAAKTHLAVSQSDLFRLAMIALEEAYQRDGLLPAPKKKKGRAGG